MSASLYRPVSASKPDAQRTSSGCGESLLQWPVNRYRVRGPQVDPVLGWVVVEGEQHVEVVGDLRGGLGPLDAELGGERLRGGSGVGLVLGVVDLRERGSRGRLGRLRQRGKGVARLVGS